MHHVWAKHVCKILKTKIKRQKGTTSSWIEAYCKNECFLGLGSHLFFDNVAQWVQTAELGEIRHAMEELSE